MNLKRIIQTILEDYVLPIHGDHGVAHWARVLENGRRLCEKTGASVAIVSLFAVFHDSRQINECADAEHGLQRAEFAAEQRGRLTTPSSSKMRNLFADSGVSWKCMIRSGDCTFSVMLLPPHR